MSENKKLRAWVDEMAALLKPERVEWITGEKAQADALRAEACRTGELIKLNEEKFPGCYLHRSAVNDVARVEGRTFICSKEKKDAGPTNNWMDPEEGYRLAYGLFDGAMAGRVLYVIPYSMGPVGSPFSKIGVELTDSIYVVLNMEIMTRVGTPVLEALGEGDFVKGVHAKKNVDEQNRYILHFPEDSVIFSINSAYGGNVLQGKKCFALRIASNLAKREGWLAEHMLILGVEYPDGHTEYVAAAFPSACGKTNLAMLIPPEVYQKRGYKVWCVGDDIAWLRPGKDGRLYALNPEAGFFGVAPGTSEKSNRNALISTKKDAIFTNVVQNLDDNTVWWEGLDHQPPTNALNWKGEKWDCTDGSKGAHPNSRFTTPVTNCPSLSKEFENPDGVPISAIIFGGRRKKTAPLVYQSFDFEHGVFVGSTMASETTAAAAGQTGLIRRDPMAMLPFCGYHMGDYFEHWLEVGKGLSNPPRIFHVNWFRLDDEGNFLWPGYGENMRAVMWILDRCAGRIDARKSAIGYLPYAKDIESEGLDISPETLEDLLTINKHRWQTEVKDIEEFYAKFDHLPEALKKHLKGLKDRVEAME